MADSYWRYAGDSRQRPPQSMSSLTGKRPRIDYDIPSSRDLSSFYSRDDDRGALQVIRDSDSIGASYDRYLRSGTISSYGGGQTARSMSGVPSRPVDDTHLVSMGPMDPGASVKDRSLRMEGGRPEVSLPPDASSTLFVEGLPSDCTRREVSHIFRPFVGYKEVRLVSKESRHPGGDLLVLCFVDFLSPAHAATAMDALQDLDGNPATGLMLIYARTGWVIGSSSMLVGLVIFAHREMKLRLVAPASAFLAKSELQFAPLEYKILTVLQIIETLAVFWFKILLMVRGFLFRLLRLSLAT